MHRIWRKLCPYHGIKNSTGKRNFISFILYKNQKVPALLGYFLCIVIKISSYFYKKCQYRVMYFKVNMLLYKQPDEQIGIKGRLKWILKVSGVWRIKSEII
jgi:hypothetical protein